MNEQFCVAYSKFANAGTKGKYFQAGWISIYKTFVNLGWAAVMLLECSHIFVPASMPLFTEKGKGPG